MGFPTCCESLGRQPQCLMGGASLLCAGVGRELVYSCVVDVFTDGIQSTDEPFVVALALGIVVIHITP